MGRKAKHSREEFQALALAAAQEIIAEGGLQSLNVRAVAARLGCSVGTIYNFFAGLEELVALVNGRTLDALYEALSRVPATGRPAHDLHALLDRYLAFVAANESSWTLLFEERLPEAKEPPPWYFGKIERLFALLTRIMAPLFGPRQEAALSRAVRQLWISLHGIWSLNAGGQLAFVSDESLETVAHAMLDTHLAGLAARADG